VRWRGIVAVVCVLSAMLAAPAIASPSYGGNCALYARQVTGVELAGDAGAWWGHALGRYQRGQEPSVGAVLVFRPSGHMRHGHVAVVSRVVNRREILVDQANWIRGRIVKNMSVVDASPGNDWTSVKVVELSSRTHGRENATYGFIYPTRPPREMDDRVVTASGNEKAQKAALPIRLAAAMPVPTPTRAETQRGTADRIHVQLIGYHPADEPKAKRDKSESRHGETDGPKAKRERHERQDAKADAPKANRDKRETRQADVDKPKAKREKQETQRHGDAKAKHEASRSGANEPKIKREKRESQRTDADKPKAQRETRHADASDPAKPNRPKKSSE
jgi:surface antigen